MLQHALKVTQANKKRALASQEGSTRNSNSTDYGSICVRLQSGMKPGAFCPASHELNYQFKIFKIS